MSSADSHAPPKPGLFERLGSTFGLVQLLVTGVYRHYIVGPPAPTWPLFVSVATYLVRTSSTLRSRKACADPPKSRQQLLAVAQQPTLIDKFAVKNDALPEAVVKEVEFPVKKRELPGLLASLSQAETGRRTIPAEWIIHDSLLKSNDSHADPRGKVVLFLHGGAHVRLSPKTHRTTVATISKEFKCRVLSVDYRLSPGVVFPASTLDSVSAFLYLTEELGIAPTDVIVAGDSAGGNLCLTLMQYLRDSGLPQVGAAFLLSPWCDLSTSFQSWHKNKQNDYLDIDNLDDPYHPPRLYLSATYPSTADSEAEYDTGKVSPYVSQALAPLDSLRNLPPMLVQSGGLEAIVDEAVVLVRRLRLADESNDVTHQLWTDGVHVFHAFQADRAGANALREAGKWYSRLLSDSDAKAERGSWESEIDDLLEREKQARIARAGPIKPAKPADPSWSWDRTVERLDEPGCKRDGHELARKVAEEARRVTGKKAEAEVFRPVRA